MINNNSNNILKQINNKNMDIKDFVNCYEYQKALSGATIMVYVLDEQKLKKYNIKY